ncbi:hypothetical protein BJY04DRAFT_223236 [Aspergillus karnatakaensis]|uniref:uncharacterized protein n=1 Tax=Aspergillus karnatakaensis TaxID=1810916 RepID=UPI003CCD9BCC
MPPLPLPPPNHLLTPDSPHSSKRNDNPTYITGTGNTISIPSTYGRLTTSPSPGTIAGATLGAVAGFLFILYLLYLSLTSGRRFSASTITGTSMSGTSHTPSEVFSGGWRRQRRNRRGRGGDGGEVIVEEEESSHGGRGGGGGNVVEVIEEESVVDPPPSSRYRSRSRSRSRSGSWSESGREGGRRYRRGSVRNVDPMAYGGGESEFSGRS